MKFENIKTILFDLDDTLIVERKSADDAFIETIHILDGNVRQNDLIRIIREEARKVWYCLPVIDYCRRIGISSWEALWADFDGKNDNLVFLKNIASEYRKSVWFNALLRIGISDINIAEELGNRFKRIRNSKHILFADTIEYLERLRYDFKLGMITNGTPDIQWKKINGSKLEQYFDAIIISGDFGIGKPDVSIFHETLRQLSCNHTEAIMIGNNIETDINGAKQTGIRNIWINRNHAANEFPDIQPDFEIRNLKELDEII